MTQDRSPTSRQQSRRSFVRAALATLAGPGTAALAGCQDGMLSGGEDGTTPSDDGVASSLDENPLAYVPAETVGVSYVDIPTVLDDPAVRALGDGVYGATPSAPETLSERLTRFDERAAVSLDGLEQMVAFGGQPSLEFSFAGMILATGWGEGDTVETLEGVDGQTLTEQQHAGRTLYVPETPGEGSFPTHLGVVGDGVYVLGSRDAAKGVLDVAAGDAESAGESLQNGLDAARDEPIQLAVDVPQEQFAGAQRETGEVLSLGMFSDISLVYGSAYQDGDRRGISVAFRTAGDDAADAVEDGVERYLASLTIRAEPLSTLGESAEVSVDGTTVKLAYEATVSELEHLAAEMESQSANTGNGGQRETPPLRVAEMSGKVQENEIGAIDLEVRLADGVGSIDFSQTQGIWADAQTETQTPLVHASRRADVSAPPSEFGVFTTVPGPVLGAPDKTVTIRLNLEDETPGYEGTPFGDRLPPGGGGFLHLETEYGSATARIQFPEELDGETVLADVSTDDEE